MQYIKQTPKHPYTGGSPYRQEEITRAEALQYVSEQNLTDMEAHVRCYRPVVGVLQEVTPDLWVGVGLTEEVTK